MPGALPAKVLFVTVADNRIGFGHLNRCLSVANIVVTMGVTPQFAVFGDVCAASQVSHAKFPLQMFPVAELAQEFRSKPVDVAIVDVVYPAYFRDGNQPMDLFGPLRRSTRVITAIDTLGEETIAEQACDIPVDFLAAPYALAEADKARLAKVSCQVLCGPDYALLSPDYIGLADRAPRPDANRVLVTCGGSDPLSWTPVVLAALESIGGHLSVRVIVGPLFSLPLRAEIAKCAATSRHQVEIVDAPDSLATHMQWCDVAIAASGLTKYELAATGTPTVLFSIDAFHDENNGAFAALQVTEDLGASPSQAAIAAAARGLLADRGRRMAMSASARGVVDGRGAQRLIAKVMEKLSCSEKN
jgi:spore coat polysaccharide biosynthesis predicted glycosyltransferase SpsG